MQQVKIGFLSPIFMRTAFMGMTENGIYGLFARLSKRKILKKFWSGLHVEKNSSDAYHSGQHYFHWRKDPNSLGDGSERRSSERTPLIGCRLVFPPG